MFKKFKVIKEFPNSDKLGTIIEPTNYYAQSELARYPEFYEQVKIKEYEILSFISSREIYKKREDGLFRRDNFLEISGWQENTFNINEPIYSIKRLSDSEVFTIGDNLNQYKATIKSFKEVDGGLQILSDAKGDGCVTSNLSWNLQSLKKAKEVLFTTEDGYKIYERGVTPLYYVYDNYGSLVCSGQSKWMCDSKSKDDKYFYSKEKAEEYIAKKKEEQMLNKPLLSINEVVAISKKYTFASSLGSELKELVKSKM